MALFRPTTGLPILQIVRSSIDERREKLESKQFTLDDKEINRGDFLSRFLDAQVKDPSVPPW